MRDETFGWFAEDVVEHAVAEDALEGRFVGFRQGGERVEGDRVVFGNGGGDVEPGDVVEGEGGDVLLDFSFDSKINTLAAAH